MSLYIIFSILSAASLIAAVTVFFRFFAGAFKQRQDWPFQPAYIAGMGLTFLACWMILIPVYAYGTEFNAFQTVVSAFSSTLQAFTIDLSAADIMGMISGNIALQIYFSLFVLICPILTVGALLSMLKDFFEIIRISALKHRGSFNFYIFSELTPESITLAESMREEEIKELESSCAGPLSEIKINRILKKRMLLVFTDVHASDEESLAELIERANAINALTVKTDATVLKLFCDLRLSKNAKSPRGRRWFFAIGRDENENVSQTLTLNSQWQEYVKNRRKKKSRTIPDARFFVFSFSEESEYLFSKAVRENIAAATDVPVQSRGLIHRVNELRSLIYNRLYQYGTEMFPSDTPAPGGKPVSKNHISRQERINAVVVGLGGYGFEMVKALPWYCHMNRGGVRIDVFDKFGSTFDNLRFRCPALFSEDNNGAASGNRQGYKIVPHMGVDVFNAEFDKEFSKLPKPDFILVSLGADADNINAAMHIRMLCERLNIHPRIEAIVYDTERARALSDLYVMAKNKQTKMMEIKYRYDIDFIGDIKSCYSYENVLKPTLYDEAYDCHIQWASSEEEREQFYISEYCYRSSMAVAIRQSARLKLGYIDREESEETANDPNYELSSDRIEHIGWWVWMLTEGFEYSSERNDLARFHPDMVPFSELIFEEKEKDLRMVERKRKMSKGENNV